MKALYTILMGCIISGAAFSQGTSVEIISEEDGQNYAGETVEVNGDGYEISKLFYVKNTGTTNTFYWGRTITSNSNDDFIVQLCDDNICYSTTGEFWVSPKKTVETGNQIDFKPQLSTKGQSGTAEIIYYVLDANKNKVDSLTVIFNSTSTLGVDQQNKIAFNVYPNPAQDIITITGEISSKGATVIFVDALGKEVMHSSIKDSNSKINISELKRGVYFLNIQDKNGSNSTMQRLIKK